MTSTAFISPTNKLLAASANGWNGSGTISIAIDQAVDGRVDTVSRFIPNDAASPTEGCSAYWTFATATPIRVVALLNHNIPSGVAVFVTRQDESLALIDFQIVPVSEGIDGYPRNLVIVFPESADTKVLNFTIGDGASGDPLPNGEPVDVGEFWAGEMWTPEYGISFETQLGFNDPSLQAFSAGGQGFTSPRNLYREVTLMFPALTEAEFLGAGDGALSLKSIFGMSGARTPVLVAPTTSSQFLLDTTGICGLMSASLKATPVARKDNARVYKASLDIRELR